LFLTAVNLPSSVVVSFLSAIPIVVIAFTGFKQVDDVDDDNIDGLFEFTDSTLWALRVLGPLLMSILATLSYWNLRKYALTSPIARSMNDIVHSRVDVREDNTIESESVAECEENALPAIGLVQDQEKESYQQLLLHMSVEEIGVMAISTSPGSSLEASEGLNRISRNNSIAFWLAGIDIFAVLVALMLDILYGKSVFSTLLVSLFLLVSFYWLYEFLRRTAINEIRNWENASLQHRSSVTYSDHTRYHETLKEKIARDGIKDDEDSEEPFCSPLTADVIPTNKELTGYKRTYTCLLVVLLASILTSIVDVF
jgi:hypothetical protein